LRRTFPICQQKRKKSGYCEVTFNTDKKKRGKSKKSGQRAVSAREHESGWLNNIRRQKRTDQCGEGSAESHGGSLQVKYVKTAFISHHLRTQGTGGWQADYLDSREAEGNELPMAQEGKKLHRTTAAPEGEARVRNRAGRDKEGGEGAGVGVNYWGGGQPAKCGRVINKERPGSGGRDGLLGPGGWWGSSRCAFLGCKNARSKGSEKRGKEKRNGN